ncbi:putative phosphotransferase family protein [Phaeoacremonium minimum UCRPA7]|uniref:Putative phosphotransferase family protein n=1 Tax=Phaeoacremonium minimum (strain UCR-PA7) TaxID=1286976 RepID=R8BJP5_PHAM7|nr:putative phosphotransferase family protein [Phaeoacremonium minimum UCRPA7]EON99437.1 putative phosphotransferase family protein [Phaeoacremonium minimum UCRPA7]
MSLVKQHTRVPVPGLFHVSFRIINGEEVGYLSMEKAPGVTLESAWPAYDEQHKARVCADIWHIVEQLRTIPKPHDFAHLFQCGADGSIACSDVLLRDLQSPPRPIPDDDGLRARIYERYHHYWGRLYEHTLPAMLPRSDGVSVFTHGDLTPRNIIVDKSSGCITGILDWENAGWFPDYWEYANIMKPSRDKDWMRWMDDTKPAQWQWDISGIVKARKVLF